MEKAQSPGGQFVQQPLRLAGNASTARLLWAQPLVRLPLCQVYQFWLGLLCE